MTRYLSAALLVLTAMLVTGCGFGSEDSPDNGGICDLFGCRSEIQVGGIHLPDRAQAVMLCAGDRCRTEPLRGPDLTRGEFGFGVPCKKEPGSELLTVKILGEEGRVLVAASHDIEVKRPPGSDPECHRNCWQGYAEFDGRAGTIVEVAENPYGPS